MQTQLLEHDQNGTGARLQSELPQGYRGADSVVMEETKKEPEAKGDEELIC